MIQITSGNLLTAPAQALVNTVNTEGVMGKGIALQFRQAYPEMFGAYVDACRANLVKLGQMDIHDLGGLAAGPRWIINFPTKGHWRSKSRLKDIETGLVALVGEIRRLGIESIAIPPLGCGHGGLRWDDVRPMIEKTFAAIPDVHVLLFSPSGAPKANEMPNRTKAPVMTEGRAALIALMNRYLQGLLDPFISLLELHKLMYFMQEAGQDLRLEFDAGRYGPYAHNLRHVLIRMEGHHLQGYGDGEDTPGKPMELLAGAVAEASSFLRKATDVQLRLDRVAALIEGYEDAYGMELLSSVHWVMCHDVKARDNADVAIRLVHEWNGRKATILKPEHLRKAWDRLKQHRWDRESRNAIH